MKDAVNTIWWLSKDPHPKANNRNVLKPYSDAMNNLLKNGYKAKLRPSGHNISKKFNKNQGGAIPPNIINVQENNNSSEIGDLIFVNSQISSQTCIAEAVNVISASNTSSNDYYQRRCKEEGIKRHPARFPSALPEFFINFCTEKEDLVLDPFAGSNMTGRVAESLERRWMSIEIEEEYIKGSQFRFEDDAPLIVENTTNLNDQKKNDNSQEFLSELPLFNKSNNI